MRIDAIDVFRAAHPLREPWTTAYGPATAVHGVLVRLRSGEHSGWAESNTSEQPTFAPEYADGTFATIASVMAPRLIGRTIESAGALQWALSDLKGNNFAKAAVEMAWWQLRSSMDDRPLHELLGGANRAIPVGEALGVMEDTDLLLQRIAEAFDRGYDRIKLKVRPEQDIDVLRTVRAAFPDGGFLIDCNCGYTIDDLSVFQAMDELDLLMIEQPLAYDNLVDHATLQRAVRTPICLDEGCASVQTARAAIELGACRVMNIKPPRVGGIRNSMAIIDLCRERGIGAWIGCFTETAIGSGCNLALASLPDVSMVCEIFPTQRFYDEEITATRMELSGPGTMRPLDVPASSCEPTPDQLEERTLQHVSVT